MRIRYGVLLMVMLYLSLAVSSCGGGATTTANPSITPGELSAPVENAWPTGLPNDFVQPWEELDANGKVVAGINADSEFLCGVERVYDSGTSVSDNGEAVHLASGDAGSGEMSWVMYRLLMEGAQPGVVSADVNLGEMSDGSVSEYFVGLSNYGDGSWDWHGPFTDSHVRVSTGADIAGGADYLSSLGNHFVTIVAFDGAVLDVIGVGTNAYNALDTEVPPVPNGLFAVPVYGGLDLNWNDVLAGDLAGYRLYYSNADFSATDEAGVTQADYLIGQGNHLLTGLTAATYVRVSAVDISGNESALSDSASQTPLAGNGPDMRLGVSAVSGLINEMITLTATGAVNYAWDLDGNGIFEITGDTTGTQPADTGRTGIIRPGVRGTTEDGSCVSCAAVSLVIAGNSRPVANAYATPTTGNAPLLVTLAGGGVDDDGTLVSFSWDFDGDGVFDQTDTIDPGPVAHTYEIPGLYNAKFRVEDELGSWDVDTVAVHIYDPANRAPTADLVIGAGEESGDAPHSVHLDASGSTDPDPGDSIVRYWWDLDGDGMYEGTTDNDTYNHTYTSPGIFTAKVKVEDSHGATDTATVEITVNVAGNDSPVADLTASPLAGDAPLFTTLDASGSSDSDGTIVRYDWDLDDDGNYELYDGGATPSWTYTTPDYHNPVVRVTDDAGAQDTATVQVTARGWRYMEFGNSDPDDIISMIVVDGNPAIACEYDEWPNHQTYRRASDPLGLEPWGEVTEFWDPRGGNDTTMAIVNGNPAIAYNGIDPVTDGTHATFVRATDAQGNAWGTSVQVGAVETGDCFLAVVDGYPAMVYHYWDWPNDEIRYRRATDANGTAWGTHVVLATGDTTAYPGALLVADGNPAVIYFDYTNARIDYIRATDAQGTAWGTATAIVTEDDPDDYITDPHAAIVDGNPAVVYGYRETDPSDTVDIDDDIRYLRADDASGSSWSGTPVVVSNNTWDVDDMGNMTIINGNPAFVFEWDDGDKVIYVRATDATGSTWGTPEHVDPWNWTVYDDMCLAEVDGHPAVAYHYTREPGDYDKAMLKYAIQIK